MTTRLYNSLTKKIEEFKPLKKGIVHMYVCGPTVYDYIHIGNARTFVAFDVIRRYLEYKGFDVLFVSNITDVGHLTEDEAREDKILKRAKREKLEPMELVDKYTQAYFEDLDRLKNLRPDISPRATGHIIKMIETVKTLVDRGYGYIKKGSVYYDISKFKDYGKLSGNTLKKLKAGARVKVKGEKKSPFDFALWQKAKKGHIMRWPSPWGEGFPGWHIECSVMSSKYLGTPFDIHGGGKDLKFPHHENEIAQAEAATGKKFCNYWLHTEYISINGEKMSKSKGNFFTARELMNAYGDEVVRLFLVSTQYRRPIDYSEQQIKAAKKTLDRVYTALSNAESAIENKKDTKKEDGVLENQTKESKEGFEKAMGNDFNTAEAISKIYELIRGINESSAKDVVSKKSLKKAMGSVRELGSVLGVFQKVLKKEVGGEKLDAIMKLVLNIREDARKKKDFKTSDKIRSELKKAGITVEDSDEGQSWHA